MSRGFMDWGLKGNYCQCQEHRPRLARRSLIKGGVRHLLCEECYEKWIAPLRAIPSGNNLVNMAVTAGIVTERE